MSYIPALQKQAIILKNKKDSLKIIGADMDKFIGLPEHEALSQKMAITDMQLQHAKNALVF